MAEKSKYVKGSQPRKPENLEDRVIEERRPGSSMRGAQSPDPTGRSRMKLRRHNPNPEKVMYYI